MVVLENPEEPNILVCAAVEGNPPEKQVPGSITAICGSCDKEIYVSPSGQKLLTAGEATPLCGRCAQLSVATYYDQTGKRPPFAVAPGALEELTDALVRDQDPDPSLLGRILGRIKKKEK